MRISGTGPAAASYGAAQAEIEGMLSDNAALTGVHTVAASAARFSAATNYAQALEIYETEDARGRIPPRAGKVLLVNQNMAAKAALQFLDPVAGTIADGPAHSDVTATAQFSCAVRLPNGTILLVPFRAAKFWIYDPWADTVTATVTHGRDGLGSVPAFGGAAVGKDGLVYLCSGYNADKKICIYDPTAHTLTVSATALPYHTDWQTVDNTGPVVPLPDGDILFFTRRAVDLGAPWRYRPSTGALTNATRTSSTGASNMNSAYLTADGKNVVLGEYLNNKVRMYRLSDNTLYDALVYGSNGATNAFGFIFPMQDGRLGFAGQGYAKITIFDPVALTWSIPAPDLTTVGWVANSSSNCHGALMLSSGKVLFLPRSNLTTLVLYTPYAAGVVPEGVLTSRYLDRI